MKTVIALGGILLAGMVGMYVQHEPNNELQQAEAHLEQTTGSKLKDTWPAFRDSLCKNMVGEELNECRIYQTEHFEAQILLYRGT